jgi:hypothetical protein
MHSLHLSSEEIQAAKTALDAVRQNPNATPEQKKAALEAFKKKISGKLRPTL